MPSITLSFARLREIVFAVEVVHTPELFRQQPDATAMLSPHHLLIYHEYDAREISDADGHYALGHDTTFLFVADRPYHLAIPPRPYHAWAVCFTADPDDRYAQETRSQGVFPLLPLPVLTHAGSHPAIREHFAEIRRCWDTGEEAARLKARCLLGVLLSEMYQLGQEEHAWCDPRITRVIAYLDAHPAVTISIDALAERFNLSRRALLAGFKRQTGQTIVTYQHALRIRLAAAQLQHDPGLPLKVLAQQLGFYDEFYFSKIFKRHMGLSPQAFRQTRV